MRVLFLTHRLPYAPNRGDRLRAFHILQQLRSRLEVDLFSLVHDADEEAHASDLRGLAASVTTARVSRPRNLVRGAASLVTARPLTHALLDSPHATSLLDGIVANRKPDVVLAYCSSMARFALERPLEGIPFVLDMVDVDSVKWSELARTASFPMSAIYAREANTLRRFEMHAIRRARATLVVNARERDVVAALVPDANVIIVPIGIDVRGLCPPSPPVAEPVVVFSGVMNYGPNEQGALWLAREVWPKVRSARPDARLVLAGANPTPAVRALAGADSSIVVTGTVDDIRPFLWNAAVAAAPLLVARGVQNKVLEAIAAGLPCVVTRAVYEGLPAAVTPSCVLADDAGAFAEAVTTLLGRTAAERRAIVARADLTHLNWTDQLSGLSALLMKAGDPQGSVSEPPDGEPNG